MNLALAPLPAVLPGSTAADVHGPFALAIRRADLMVAQDTGGLLQHMRDCDLARDPWFAAKCLVEWMDQQLARRIISTLALSCTLLWLAR